MSSEAWLFGLLVVAIIQTGNFFRLAFLAKVFSIFGRKGMNSGGLVYLASMAAVPAISIFLILFGPFDIFGFDSELENSVAICIVCGVSDRVMAWLSIGVASAVLISQLNRNCDEHET